MTDGANASYVIYNASYVNLSLAVDDLYMRVNSHVICKIESGFFAVVENDATLCPNERKVRLKFCVHLFGGLRRHCVLSSFNCNLFSIIQYLTSEMHVSTEEIAL